MCGHGGIGRRVTLRSLWAKPVEVQVFLAAPLCHQLLFMEVQICYEFIEPKKMANFPN